MSDPTPVSDSSTSFTYVPDERDPFKRQLDALAVLRGTPALQLERSAVLRKYLADLPSTTRVFCIGEVRIHKVGHYPAAMLHLDGATFAVAPGGDKGEITPYPLRYFHSQVPYAAIAKEVLAESADQVTTVASDHNTTKFTLGFGKTSGTRHPIKHLEDVIPLSPWAKPSIDVLRSEMDYDVGHDEAHLIRVVANALYFGEDGDPDIIIPAAILHDLVNVPKSDKERRPLASKLSADKACELLEKILPWRSDIQRLGVHHAITAHSWSAKVQPETLEARAVQDADRCDSLGMVGIARCLAVSGALGRPLFDQWDPAAEFRDLDENAYSIDHFKTKLFGLADTMQTPRGRAEAALRTAKMRNFYDELVAEIKQNPAATIRYFTSE